MVERVKVGMIVNPLAGIGGRVGLKGSDGLAVQRRAVMLGARPEATARAAESLRRLLPLTERVDLITWGGEMGADAARMAGFPHTVLATSRAGQSTSADTQTAARNMLWQGCQLLLFSGGDGTARDIYQAAGFGIPVVGIPAGVKNYSAVFAASPRKAGELAGLFLEGQISRLAELDVLDLDEESFRSGRLIACSLGKLRVPFDETLLQGAKLASVSDEKALAALAQEFLQNWLQPDVFYIIGPGTTTRALLFPLGLPKTLLGVDVLYNGQVVATDASEQHILSLVRNSPAKIVISPLGGQGFLFGRGNQPISPAVIRAVGRENILVFAALDKIYELNRQPLLVDTGDVDLDRDLAGPIPVITGVKVHTTCLVE